MRFISLCSGIEAASVAFGPLGWSAVAFSEIEPFPCELLAHHYPHVPNMGDMSRFAEWPDSLFIEADAIVGGPPCQAFSVAGARAGLSDARGNLTLIYAQLIDHADRLRRAHGCPPVVALYENVPGLLSSTDNAFGCLLAGLAGSDDALVAPGKPRKPGKAIPWPNAGCVLGPERAIAWRTLDAQYTRLAQRRRRVFVVASARAGFDPGAVLFEFEGVRRDSPPSRSTPENVAGALARCSFSGGAGGRPEGAAANHFVAATLSGGGRANGGYSYDDVPLVAATLDVSYGRLQGCSGQDANHGHSHLVPTVSVAAWGGNRSSGPLDVATACNAKGGAGRMDFESETLVTVTPFQTHGSNVEVGGDTFGTLLGNCDRASGSAPCVAIGFNARQDPDSWADRVGPLDTDGTTLAVCVTVPVTHTLNTCNGGKGCSEDGTGRGTPIVAFSCKDYAADAGPISPTLRAMGHSGSHANAGGQDTATWPPARVRRLMPIECERLQGFADNYTAIPRGRAKKPAADGPRYKALGNSWAIPCVAWIGRRITAQLQ